MLNATYTWDFGDSGSQYNQLVGWNAGHAYETPGQYTVTLTLTDANGQSSVATGNVTVVSTSSLRSIYISPNGSDSNNGSTPGTAIQSISDLNQILTSNTMVYFEAGGTYDTTSGININGYSNVELSSYGSGAQPVIMYNGAETWGALVAVQANSNGIVINGLTFNEIYSNVDDSIEMPSAISLTGNAITVTNNTFLNALYDMNLSAQPSNVLIQNNQSPVATDLNGYFAWIQGQDISLVGNTVAGSNGETTIRVGGANVLLIADNNVTDTVKGTIALQAGTFAYVYGNTVNDGPIGVGPLGVAGADPNASFTDCVFDSNNIFSTLMIQPGSNETMVKNNVIHEDGGAGITINGQGGFNWEVQNVYIQNNTVIQTGPWAGFLTLNGGAAVNVNVNNNLLVAPQLQTGSGQGIIVLDQNDLSSFGEIQNNVWAIPQTSSWAPDGYFYVDSESGQQAGYLSPAQWEALGATGDVYENVTPGSTYSVEVDGFTAGSPLSTGS